LPNSFCWELSSMRCAMRMEWVLSMKVVALVGWIV
jgi:hypothetical protein